MVVFIRREALEDSLNYLVCPSDKEELKLNINKSDSISEGEFQCNECGKTYEIRDGVPYFFEKGNGFEWKDNSSDKRIIEDIAETISDKDLTWSKIIALGPIFLNGTKDRRKAIDKIFNAIEEVIRISNVGNETEAYLTQAATTARYDIEIYRGTFKLPKKIMEYLSKNYDKEQGIIVEGACATGDCLLEIKNKLNSEFYIGLDISGAMARESQRNAEENMLFIQGDISSLPLKKNSVGIYALNNVFDRVANPLEACSRANSALNKENSFLVLSNCDPLQFKYTTEEGEEIIFVPKEKQLSLDEGLIQSGFTKIMEQKGTWQIETAAYGKESLPYRSLIGVRKK